MAKNDVILIDGIINQRISENYPSIDRGEVFELFSLEQILKDYDLSKDELESGWTDGANDGGIDGFYIFINGHLLDDVNTFLWPKAHASIDVYLITCKHHATFEQAPLDLLVASISELFDFSLDKSELKGSYSDDIFECRNLLYTAYSRLSISKPTINFSLIYASRGNTNEIGESVKARSEQIKKMILELFSSSNANFDFIGATELIDMHRKTKTFSLALPYLEHLTTGESHVLLVKLFDYYKFVSDENGQLRRYLFDSNVRDYLGNNNVNDDIKTSLNDENGPNFWWLNNGITILVTDAAILGKSTQLQNIQIVNGLQTTETIYEHFQSGSLLSENRTLLVKIIVSNDAQARDLIIRATNNQSPVEISALRATDKIQRDIEEILERHDWYYERRRNYYRNIGKPQIRFVTPLYLASAIISLILKNPVQATRLRSKFMRDQKNYDKVFSNKYSITIFPILVDVYKKIDIGLSASHASTKSERFISAYRPLLAFLIVSKTLNNFGYTHNDLINIDLTKIDTNEINTTLDEISDILEQQTKKNTKRFKTHFVMECCKRIEKIYNLPGIQNVNRRSIEIEKNKFDKTLDETFLSQINSLLPNQPWPVGIHNTIALQLSCEPQKVASAINKLINNGQRYRQIDGTVYSKEGNILMIDPERAEFTSS